MSKVYARISAIIMSVLCLVLGCVLVYDKTYRYNAEGETLVTTLGEGQPLKVQHLSFSSNPKDHWDDVIKEAQGTSSNSYIDSSTNVNPGDDVMLETYKNQNTTDVLYISFAYPENATNGQTAYEVSSADKNSKYYTNITSVTLTINGDTSISLSEYKNGGEEKNDKLGIINGSEKTGGSNSINTSYFVGVIDLNKYSLLSNVETGQYTLSFIYSYLRLDKNNSNSNFDQLGQSVNNLKYEYSFYLFSDEQFATSYTGEGEKTYNNYPEFLNYSMPDTESETTDNDVKLNDDNELAYFYYDNQSTRPTLEYDIDNYHLSFYKQRETRVLYDTSVTRDSDGKRTLHITTEGQPEQTLEVSPTKINGVNHYIARLVFYDLSTYYFTASYQILTNDGYRVLDIPCAYNGKILSDASNVVGENFELHVYGARLYAEKNIDGSLQTIPMYYSQDGYTFDANYTARMNVYQVTTDSNSNIYKSLSDKNGTNGSSQYDKFSDLLIPSTNLSGLHFDVYGLAALEGNTPVSKIYYYNARTIEEFKAQESPTSTTNLYFNNTFGMEAGFYIIKISFTFNERSTNVYSEYFIFAKTDGQPKTAILTMNENNHDTAPLSSPFFTNKNVVMTVGYNPEKVDSSNGDSAKKTEYANYLNYSYFCSPYEVEIRRKSFETTNAEYTPVVSNDQFESYFAGSNQDSYTTLTDDGNYEFVVKYGKLAEIVYTFVIDTTPIGDIQVYDALSSNGGYLWNIDSATGNPVTKPNITSNAFGLHFFQKQSGARISVSYKSYQLSYDSNAAKKYILTNNNIGGGVSTDYKISLSAMKDIFDNTNAAWTPYNYNGDAYGSTSVTNPLNSQILYTATSTIYYFHLVDQAGNEANIPVMIDKSQPYIYLHPKATNSLNIITNDTTVYWSANKAFEIDGYADSDGTKVSREILGILGKATNTASDTGIVKGSEATDDKTPIEQQNNGSNKNYVFVGISDVLVDGSLASEGGSVTNLTPTTYSPTVHKFLQYFADTTQHPLNQQNAVYSGEGAINIRVTDAAGNQSMTTVEMNFDNTLGIIFVENNNGKVMAANNILWRNVSATQLHFTYLSNVSSYTVASVQYAYFPFSLDRYAALLSSSSTTMSDINGILSFNNLFSENGNDYDTNQITFPFGTQDATWHQLTFDNGGNNKYTVANESGNTRVASGTINELNGSTREGLYVIKRTYSQDVPEGSKDKKIKYFTIIVDRSGVFSIDPAVVDEDQLKFQVGGGTSFKLGSTVSETLNASLLQTYINNSSTLAFTDKKLPVTLNIALDKYNTYAALSALNITGDNAQDFIENAIKLNEETYFPLYKQLSYVDGGATRYILDSVLVDPNKVNTDDWDSDTIATTTVQAASNYALSLHMKDIFEENNPSNIASKFSFNFLIQYDTPNAEFSRGSNHSFIPTFTDETTTGGTVRNVVYNNINDQELYLTLNDYKTIFEARIDLTNIQISYNGTTYNVSIDSSNKLTVNGVEMPEALQVEDSRADYVRYTIDMTKICGNHEGTYSAKIVHYDSNHETNIQVTIDRTAPTLNFDRLLDSDRWLSNREDYESSYFFPISSATEFVNNNSTLETQMIYFKKLGTANDDFNYSTYTPSNSFNSSDYNNSFISWPANTETITAADILRIYAGDIAGYYEFVEVDQAGNYTKYVVHLSDGANTFAPTLRYTNLGTNTYSNVTPSDEAINGQGLELVTMSGAVDGWQRVTISDENGTLYDIKNDPRINGIESFDAFIAEFNSAIAAIEADTAKTSYSFNIRFINRYDSTYDLAFVYTIPTPILKIVPVQLSANEFSITIPRDTVPGGKTELVRFEVYQFTNNAWNLLSQDARGKAIPSHPNADDVFVFGVGAYKFTTLDNFDRLSEEYYAFGVQYTVDIDYGAWSHVTIDDVNYTAHHVTMTFPSPTYQSTISYMDPNNSYLGWQTYNTTSPLSFADITISEINSLRTITVVLRSGDVKSFRFRIELVTNGQFDTEGHPLTSFYEFEITHELQNIIVTNVGDEVISGISRDRNNPTEISEDFKVTWSDGRFGATVRVERTYFDSTLNRNITQVIDNVTKGYTLTLEGTYRLSITNGLGYSDTSNDLYIRKIISNLSTYAVIGVVNGIEQRFTASPLAAVYNTRPLHTFYVTSIFDKPESDELNITFDGDTTGDISGNYILIRVNRNNNLVVERVANSNNRNLFRIYGTGSMGAERYVEIIRIASESNIAHPSFTDMDIAGEDGVIEGISDMRLATSGVVVTFDAFYSVPGNMVQADYYYNGHYVQTYYTTAAEKFTLSITTTGRHRLEFYDLAGNRQVFGTNNYVEFYIINAVEFMINEDTPIEGYITNSGVTLTLSNRSLYASTSPEVTATLNGNTITATNIGAGGGYVYSFNDPGRYSVSITSFVTDSRKPNDTPTPIMTKYNFVIISPTIATSFVSISSNLGFTIDRVSKGANENYEIPNDNSLILSSTLTGNDTYHVYVTARLAGYNETRAFDFVVWINDENPAVSASIDFGTSTSKEIVVYYNTNVIYSQIGDSYITATGYGTPIEINAETAGENVRRELTLRTVGDNWIQIFTKEGQLVASYKLTRTQPLNTAAIIVIVIASVAVVAGVVIFFVLRRRMKVK